MLELRLSGCELLTLKPSALKLPKLTTLPSELSGIICLFPSQVTRDLALLSLIVGIYKLFLLYFIRQHPAENENLP